MNQDLLMGRETNSIIKEEEMRNKLTPSKSLYLQQHYTTTLYMAFDMEIYTTFNKQSTMFGV